MTIFAYTPAEGYKAYPPYLNVRIDGDVAVVTVRGEEGSAISGEQETGGVGS